MVIKVCIGSGCHVKGSREVITKFQQLIKNDSRAKGIEVASAFCFGNCREGVSIQLDDGPEVYSVKVSTVKDFFEYIIIPKYIEE